MDDTRLLPIHLLPVASGSQVWPSVDVAVVDVVGDQAFELLLVPDDGVVEELVSDELVLHLVAGPKPRLACNARTWAVTSSTELALRSFSMRGF